MNNPLELGMQDPNNTGAPDLAGGAAKKKTDMSGESGRPTGASFADSLASSKASMMPTRNEGTSLPVAKEVEVMTFGDPNDTAIDFKDGAGLDSYQIPDSGNDVERYGFGK